jgi:hypothetical protein
VEDERRLHAAVGDERGVRQLRQALSEGHGRDDTGRRLDRRLSGGDQDTRLGERPTGDDSRNDKEVA